MKKLLDLDRNELIKVIANNDLLYEKCISMATIRENNYLRKNLSEISEMKFAVWFEKDDFQIIILRYPSLSDQKRTLKLLQNLNKDFLDVKDENLRNALKLLSDKINDIAKKYQIAFDTLGRFGVVDLILDYMIFTDEIDDSLYVNDKGQVFELIY